MSKTSKRVLARLAHITDKGARRNSVYTLAREVESLEARVAEWRKLDKDDPTTWPEDCQWCVIRHSGSAFIYQWLNIDRDWFLRWASHWFPLPDWDGNAERKLRSSEAAPSR